VVNASTEMGSVLSTSWNALQGADPIYEEYPYLPDSLGAALNNAIICYLQNPPTGLYLQRSIGCNGQDFPMGCVGFLRRIARMRLRNPPCPR